jgi:hypothetical protein
LALSKAALKLLAAAPNDRLSGVVKVKVTGGRAASRNVTVTLKA